MLATLVMDERPGEALGDSGEGGGQRRWQELRVRRRGWWPVPAHGVTLDDDNDGARVVRRPTAGQKIVVKGSFHINNERKRMLLQGEGSDC